MTDPTGNADFSTWGYWAEDSSESELNYDNWRTPYGSDKHGRLIVAGAAEDGNDAIYVIPKSMLDENGTYTTPKGIFNDDGKYVVNPVYLSQLNEIMSSINKIGSSLFDNSFIMYDDSGNNIGAAVGATIYINTDITDYILDKNNQTAFDPSWPLESNTGGKYDIKQELATGMNNNFPSKGHYSGFLWDSVYVSGRGGGNILYGLNLESSILPIDLLASHGADWYHNSDNNFMNFAKQPIKTFFGPGETEEAKRHYQVGRDFYLKGLQ